MKRLILAAVALGAPLAFAQMPYQTPQQQPQIEAPKAGATKSEASSLAVAKPSVDMPKPKCEDPGAYPGRVGMQTEDRRNRFVKGVENYRLCMVAFVEERRAVIERINDEQTAAQN
jgi:hypothetical protein